MDVPAIIGSKGTRLLYAPADEWQTPRHASDVISFDSMLPRDPWEDLAAGSAPKITGNFSIPSSYISFAVALTDADQETWPGYSMRSVFALAMIQHVDGEMRSSTSKVKIKSFVFEYQNGLWVGRVGFEIIHTQRLSPQSIAEA